MKPPRFWSRPRSGPAAWLLRPLAALMTWGVRHRRQQEGYAAPVPVLCCGNVTTGGTGKTPLALDLVQRLRERGHQPHILSRGHGGRERGPLQVRPGHHTARDVGDEPLLLARAAPTWVGRNRGETARLASAAGADCLIMDDGFQNPSLQKTLSILVMDGGVGLGNGHVIPAGPLREPLADALRRAQAIVVIGEDRFRLLSTLSTLLPKGQARLLPGPEIRSLQGKRVVAFAGIGRPEKFFDMLKEAGVNPIRCLPFPDHHVYSATDIQRLEVLSREAGTILVTTAKDAVKLPSAFAATVRVISVELLWDDPAFPEHLLDLLFHRP
ncbi:tetraacyldisaccharide 4'-kinase [Gluconobacter morbifer]|uniref:tetraacyldisaccharide 4'-kinase n=1 Tax=Gluconobacter morbifer TaxID=479935 RepID=UPI0038CD2D34